MPREKKCTKEEIAAAIPGSFGNRAEVARRLGVGWRTVAAYFKDDPELQDMLEAENETVVDRAEKSLMELVEDKDFRAVKFVLTTHGKHRGYSSATRTEISGVDGQPITIRYVNDWRGVADVETETDADSER
jgi:hypothetical protein